MEKPRRVESASSAALWQSRLRRSVRLLLALSEKDQDALQVEARLRLVERHLVHHLVRQVAPLGQLPTPQLVSIAHFRVQHAQTVLLTDSAAVAAILAEWPALRAIDPVRWQTLRVTR